MKEEIREASGKLTSDVDKYYKLKDDMDNDFQKVADVLDEASDSVHAAVPYKVFLAWKEYIGIIRENRSRGNQLYHDRLEALNSAIKILEFTEHILKEMEEQ